MWKKRIIRGIAWSLTLALTFGTVYHLFFWRAAGVETLCRPRRFAEETVVIDPGHGGEDGGAVSPAGNVESAVNLAISLRLDQILGLFGVDTLLLRQTDTSLHDTSADTLREKKVSDIHNRVAAVESVDQALLISIHQNSYPNGPQYHGAQVFYGKEEGSRPFAEFTQETLRLALDPNNTRQAKPIPDSIYLMNHITCQAILVECGFLTNAEEDRLLQTEEYQTRLAAALASAYLSYTEEEEGERPHAREE